jgi:hypothetical protein
MTTTLSIPTQRQHEPLTVAPVAWHVAFSPVPGQTVVSVWRTGSVNELVPQLRAGVIRQCTVRMDCTFEELVTAVGMSGHAVTDTDPLSVARAALVGFDRAGTDQVLATTAATRAVLAGEPTIQPERDQHAAVWPTLADYRQCRAIVAALVDARVVVSA